MAVWWFTDAYWQWLGLVDGWLERLRWWFFDAVSMVISCLAYWWWIGEWCALDEYSVAGIVKTHFYYWASLLFPVEKVVDDDYTLANYITWLRRKSSIYSWTVSPENKRWLQASRVSTTRGDRPVRSWLGNMGCSTGNQGGSSVTYLGDYQAVTVV